MHIQLYFNRGTVWIPVPKNLKSKDLRFLFYVRKNTTSFCDFWSKLHFKPFELHAKIKIPFDNEVLHNEIAWRQRFQQFLLFSICTLRIALYHHYQLCQIVKAQPAKLSARYYSLTILLYSATKFISFSFAYCSA